MSADPACEDTFKTSPILQFKLSNPRLAPRLVIRARLNDVLDRSLDVPIVVVMAPPGYGKTTTVALWAESTVHPVSWISLGPEDNRPEKFFAYLVAAIRVADPDSLSDELRDASLSLDLQQTVEAIVGAMGLATRHFFLVIDDFHVIDHPDILRAFTYMLNRLPPQAHVVMVSRSSPKIPLGRLRVNGQLREVNTSDLEFSAEEALSYREVAEITEIDEADWTLISERTEGWIAGLQLARILVKGKAASEVEQFLKRFDGGVPEIDDYLLEEVISGLPPALRSFMLRSSILPFLEPELCNFALQVEGSSTFIRELRDRSLFVSTIEGGNQWLRYHHLLADALERRLREELTIEEFETIHARVADWFSNHGSTDEAFRHAVTSGRWDIATEVARRMASHYSPSDRLLYMRQWLDQLPQTVVMSDPELRGLLLWSLALTSGLTSHAATNSLLDADAPGEDFDVRCHLALMQASYAADDVTAMQAHAQGVCDLVCQDLLAVNIYGRVTLAVAQSFVGSFEDAEISFTEVRRLAESGTQRWMRNRGEVRYADLLALRGRLDDALILLEQLAVNTGLALHVGDVQVYWFLANIHLERNDLDDAESALIKGLDIATATDAEHWLPVLLIARAAVDWARGLSERAAASAERARHLAKVQGNDNYRIRAKSLQAMIWVRTGQLLLAERWLLTVDPSLTWTREFNQPYPALVAVRLLAAQGQHDDALQRLDQIIAATTQRRRTADLVRLYAMRAALLQKLERTEEAAEALAVAIDLGATGGFLRSFLDEGNALAGLFNHPLLREHTHRHYAQMVKRSFERETVVAPHAPGQMVEALSPREIDVLRLVADGRSNRGIAQELFISEPTVKKHISNIYGKLNVLNRMQAVSLARELGLI